MNRSRSVPLLVVTAAAVALSAQAPPPAPEPPPSPAHEAIVLGERGGWVASLVLDLGPKTPLWTVGALDVFPQFGCDDLVGLDDQGHVHVLEGYSGRWTPHTTVADPAWLGGLAQGDVDPRVPGPELYVAGKSGNVYEVVAHDNGIVDNRFVGNLEGREVHTLVAADVSADHPGDELLCFTNPGAVFLAVPRTDRDGFVFQKLEDLPGRVRDAVLLPRAADGAVEVAVAARSGVVEILRFAGGRLQHVPIQRLAMGAGRIALRVPAAGAPLVLYSTRDDGTIWRHERQAGDRFVNTAIYLGPLGPRGVAAGRFDPDPDVETVMVFGYSGKVELLRRGVQGFAAETVFEDRDKGHWIVRTEVDGRNPTDEVAVTGYGGRVVLLSRGPTGGPVGAQAQAAAPAGAGN